MVMPTSFKFDNAKYLGLPLDMGSSNISGKCYFKENNEVTQLVSNHVSLAVWCNQPPLFGILQICIKLFHLLISDLAFLVC